LPVFKHDFLTTDAIDVPYGSGHSERVNCIHMGNSNQEISTLENCQGLKTQQWYSYMYISQKYIHVCTESYTKTDSKKRISNFRICESQIVWFLGRLSNWRSSC